LTAHSGRTQGAAGAERLGIISWWGAGIGSRHAAQNQADIRISGPSPPSSVPAGSGYADLPARLPGGSRAQRGHQRIGDFRNVARGGFGRRRGSSGVHAAARTCGHSRSGAPQERVPLRLPVRRNKFGTRYHRANLPTTFGRKFPMGLPIFPDPATWLGFKTSAQTIGASQQDPGDLTETSPARMR
jgi:hypothetical protein